MEGGSDDVGEYMQIAWSYVSANHGQPVILIIYSYKDNRCIRSNLVSSLSIILIAKKG